MKSPLKTFCIWDFCNIFLQHWILTVKFTAYPERTFCKHWIEAPYPFFFSRVMGTTHLCQGLLEGVYFQSKVVLRELWLIRAASAVLLPAPPPVSSTFGAPWGLAPWDGWFSTACSMVWQSVLQHSAFVPPQRARMAETSQFQQPLKMVFERHELFICWQIAGVFWSLERNCQ